MRAKSSIFFSPVQSCQFNDQFRTVFGAYILMSGTLVGSPPVSSNVASGEISREGFSKQTIFDDTGGHMGIFIFFKKLRLKYHETPSFHGILDTLYTLDRS